MSGREREEARISDFTLTIPPVDWVAWYALTTQGKSVLDQDDRRLLESVEALRNAPKMFDLSTPGMRSKGVTAQSAKIALSEKTESGKLQSENVRLFSTATAPRKVRFPLLSDGHHPSLFQVFTFASDYTFFKKIWRFFAKWAGCDRTAVKSACVI